MAAKAKVNWSLIEPDWRAGVKSPQQIANEYTAKTGVGVTRGAINKHFRELGIPRDLSEKIRQKADAMVSAAMVSLKVSPNGQGVTMPKDAEIIEVNAAIQAGAILTHRKDINRMREIHAAMVDELSSVTQFRELFENLGELMDTSTPIAKDKLNQLYMHVIGLPSRIKGVKELSDTLKTLIGLEREALNITDRTPGSDDDPIASLIRRVQGSALKPVTIEATRYEKDVN